jgi:sulfate-transporting ATPase
MAAASALNLQGVLDHRPLELSFGMRRLVGIARSIAASPSVLLLDEPASGLDPAEVDELAGLIRELAKGWGIGILLVEHNLDMVLSVADEVTVMAEGSELAPAAAPNIVRTNPAVLAAYVGTDDSDVDFPPTAQAAEHA